MPVPTQTTGLEHLLLERDGPTARVTLNEPDRYNALSLGLMTELCDVLQTLGAEDAVRVIVLAGAGDGFSAGHDLSEMIDREAAFQTRLFEAGTRLMQTVHEVPQPVIASVHGVAASAGCQLVAACDLAVAEAGARFGTPGVRIGLACATPIVAVSRAIGRKRAMHLLLTGELIDAATARDWGLVNDVVPATALAEAVDALAARLAEASRMALVLSKDAFYAQVECDESGAYDIAERAMTAIATTPDAQLGMGASLAKRSALWRAG